MFTWETSMSCVLRRALCDVYLGELCVMWSERGCTKAYRGLGSHFWPVNDHFFDRSAIIAGILVFSPRSKFWGAKRPARTGREDGQKKNLNFFFKGSNFNVQNGPFFNFSHCKWSFLIARRSSLEILVFSPRSKFRGAKQPARTGREDG